MAKSQTSLQYVQVSELKSLFPSRKVTNHEWFIWFFSLELALGASSPARVFECRVKFCHGACIIKSISRWGGKGVKFSPWAVWYLTGKNDDKIWLKHISNICFFRFVCQNGIANDCWFWRLFGQLLLRSSSGYWASSGWYIMYMRNLGNLQASFSGGVKTQWSSNHSPYFFRFVIFRGEFITVDGRNPAKQFWHFALSRPTILGWVN